MTVDPRYIPRVGGAIDLGALKTTQEGGDGAAAQTVDGEFVISLSEKNLRSCVELSTQVPVLVVVTSQQSPSSVKQAADLAQIARAGQGRFQLAQLDADAEPQVAAALRVQTVPYLLGILEGQPIPLADQPLEKAILENLCEKYLQVAAQSGITGRVNGQPGAAEPTLPPEHAEALAALEKGDLAQARAAYEKALRNNPCDEVARESLSQIALLERSQADSSQTPEQILATADAAGPQAVEAALAAADVEILSGQPDAAFARLLATIAAVSGEEREPVRLRLLELFDVVGSNEPLVVRTRRKLAAALF